jgi:ribose transport system substrate-binding protein
MDISLIVKPLNEGYWEPVRVGANRAMAELKLGGQVETPVVNTSDGNPEVNKLQSDLINQRVVDGYRGIALAPNQNVLEDTVNTVPDTVPVITVDSDLANSKRLLFIGTDAVSAGRTGGATLASQIPQKSGTVFVLGTDSPDWADGYARSFAAKEVLEQAGFTVVVHKVGWGPSTIQRDFDVLTQAIPAADPPTVGCLGVFSNAYRCVDIVKQLGYAPGQIKIAAFDFDATTLQYMKDGYILATHAQRQYYMGYLVPYALYSINTLGLGETVRLLGKYMLDEHRFDTGVDVVMADQLDSFNTFLDSLGISGS